MKQTIKKGVIFGLTSVLTMIIAGLTYAAVSNTISTGDTLTASMWNEMAGNYDYNTSEVNTGKKWIDGKPIYRKVIDLGDISSNANDSGTLKTVSLNTSGDNIDDIVFQKAIFANSDYPTFYASNSNQFRYYLLSENLNLRVSTNYSGQLSDVKVVMEYTKTTD